MIRIHFLNVGHGDCTIIEFPTGQLSIVDINRSSDMDNKDAAEIYEELTGEMVLAEVQGGGILGPLALKKYGMLELASKGYDIPLTDPIRYISNQLSGYQKIFRFISALIF